jgi:methionyl-tRNA formyltransferase
VARIGRVAFLGTGAFGVPLLERLPDLADALLVVSAPDRPAGRRLQLRPSPVAALARDLDLPLVTPARLRSDEGRAALAGFRPDGLLLAAYGQLVPRDLLAMGERPPLNVHPSLLPRHRGAAPVAGTILAGDAETGVTLMVMTEALDAGPIVAQWRVALDGREEAPPLEARLAELAAREVPPLLERWRNGALRAEPQDDARATVTHALTRDDGWIDWRAEAVAIDRQVRALQPWPGAWTTLDGKRLHVRRARPDRDGGGTAPGTLLPGGPPRVACGAGALRLEVVQPAGRAPMAADAWLRGLRVDHPVLGADGAPASLA